MTITMTIQNNKFIAPIQLKRGSSTNLAALNQTYASGEIIIETDTGKFKIGDGYTSYNNLTYANAAPNDGSVYVQRNGSWVAARIYQPPDDWLPEITSSDTIALVVDEDMNTWQLEATNSEVINL